MYLLLFLLVASQGLQVFSNGAGKVFNPREYPKRIATCEAVGDTNLPVDISIHYVDVNPAADTSIIMIHGWPSLWSSWSNQIQEFQDDYHLIVPDLRGFGASTHPGNGQGTMGDMVNDIVCVLAHAKVESAICVGHDWGSQVCYEAARLRPDLFAAAAGTIPYIHASGPFVPVAALVSTLPRLSYNLFFDKQTSAAIAELNKDIRRTLRAVLKQVDDPVPPGFLTNQDSFLAEWEDVDEISPPGFFSPDEEDYLVEQYSIQGFNNTLHFYTNTNRHASWELANVQGNHTIPQPVLWIFPLNDPVADWVLVSSILKSADFLPQLTIHTLRSAHWPQLENPHEFNAFLREWLSMVCHSPPKAPTHRIPDEL